MIKRKPELLAPAGNPQALRAAVENGADAVYLEGRCLEREPMPVISIAVTQGCL